MPKEMPVKAAVRGVSDPVVAYVTFDAFDDPALGFEQLARAGNTSGVAESSGRGRVAITLPGDIGFLVRFDATERGEEAADVLVDKKRVEVSGRSEGTAKLLSFF